MRAGDWLRAAERDLPLAPNLAALVSEGPVLVLAPHPDDESLGCGGLLAACAEAGHPARVVVVSDGTGSHPNSRVWPAPRLAALRQRETQAALAALGLNPARDLDFLGLPDRAVPSSGPALAKAVAALLAQPALSTLLAQPTPWTVFATWPGDPHADHAASFAIARALVRVLPAGTRLYAYPVWGLAFAHLIPGFPLPSEPVFTEAPRGFRLDVTRYLPAKRQAVAAHLSQTTGLIDDDPSGFRLPPEALALAFRQHELFLEESAA